MKDQVTGLPGHPPPRHVWVTFTGRAGESSPGLFLGWRQWKGQWQALVIYAEGGGNIDVKSHQAWLDASHITLRD